MSIFHIPNIVRSRINLVGGKKYFTKIFLGGGVSIDFIIFDKQNRKLDEARAPYCILLVRP